MKKSKGGHYVYIRFYDEKTKKCKISTFTSLEHKDGKIKDERMYLLRSGVVHSIPKKDLDLPLWSGLSNDSITDVDPTKLKLLNIKERFNRHRNFIDNYLNKKNY